MANEAFCGRGAHPAKTRATSAQAPKAEKAAPCRHADRAAMHARATCAATPVSTPRAARLYGVGTVAAPCPLRSPSERAACKRPKGGAETALRHPAQKHPAASRQLAGTPRPGSRLRLKTLKGGRANRFLFVTLHQIKVSYGLAVRETTPNGTIFQWRN